MVRELLYKPSFEKAFLSATALADTAINESFHSLSLMYSSKRFHCSPHYYRLKTKLSVLHYNSLVMQDLLGMRWETGNTKLTRKGKVIIAVKRKRGPGVHEWRREIMVESLRVREEINEQQYARRIGIPDDDVYDEVIKWWEEKEEGTLGEYEEWEEWNEEDADEGEEEEENEEEIDGNEEREREARISDEEGI
ncbi:hypothetical protein PFISCL1PPCAC_20159 [Pristionchus fissidentatus]|uniref:NAD(P)H-hydrate epimerase n=1 Tax=Pristionchus fissidentatus TaxID=1538716 RepID=A0AAV5WCW2_9BILA|nr:hypothetical protein PFISCL1PPCAC_20159 [Pristionchus fissidentatus]